MSDMVTNVAIMIWTVYGGDRSKAEFAAGRAIEAVEFSLREAGLGDVADAVLAAAAAPDGDA